MRGRDDNPAPRLSNRAARKLFLDRHGLGRPPEGEELAGLIERLGFVQIDSIATVERAHHMILASRRRSYRPQQLDDLLERRRALFEHWTHDAAVIPMSFYPHWRLRFRRDAEMLPARWRTWRRAGFEDRFDDVLARIREGGPVMAREFGGGRRRDASGWWDWHPSKTALEFLWRTGTLAIDRREGFQKVFWPSGDPGSAPLPDDRETLDWACAGALDRLGFASPREIAAFWDTASLDEARAWCADHRKTANWSRWRWKARGPVRPATCCESRHLRAGRRGAGGRPPGYACSAPDLCASQWHPTLAQIRRIRIVRAKLERDGRVVVEQAAGERGYRNAVLRTPETDRIRMRDIGPRSFDAGVPDGELAALVGAVKTSKVDANSEEIYREVLDIFGARCIVPSGPIAGIAVLPRFRVSHVALSRAFACQAVIVSCGVQRELGVGRGREVPSGLPFLRPFRAARFRAGAGLPWPAAEVFGNNGFAGPDAGLRQRPAVARCGRRERANARP